MASSDLSSFIFSSKRVNPRANIMLLTCDHYVDLANNFSCCIDYLFIMILYCLLSFLCVYIFLIHWFVSYHDDVISWELSLHYWLTMQSIHCSGISITKKAYTVCHVHVDVIKWKHFPRYWPFVREIHQLQWIPRTKPATWSFDVFFDLHLNKQLSKH